MTDKKKFSSFTKLVIIAAIFGVIAAAMQYLPRLVYSSFGDMWLTEEPGGMDPAQLAAVKKALGDASCRVVWSSSRSGNHELYLLKLPEGNLYRLTNNEYVDYFPRFSPDGGKLVFARSQQHWVSERNYDHWDVWVLDLLSGEEHLAAKNGNFPLWVDADRISFMRGSTIVIKDMDSGKEKVLYDGANAPVKGRIETPMLSPIDENLLVLTARGSRRGCLLLDIRKPAEFTDFGSGCEIIFTPDGKGVVWMENGGNGGNQVMTSPVDEVKRRVFMDLPGEFSHEYFPRLSADGKWLVWAASAGGHEHDIADYELFLWRVGQPYDQAVRITYSKANDRWPDIFVE